jgi:osmotically-inducible protein OsmY
MQSSLLVCATLCLFLLLAGCGKQSARSETDTATARTPDADNTARNVRDRADATLTPGDQGTTPADRETTQKIRKALAMDATGYSATAKNVKIITVNGKVTLRGPVKTEAEKTGIVSMAKTVAGEGNVDDQLEVKANP